MRVAPSVPENPAPAGALVIGYLVGRRFVPRYAVFLALGLGVLVAWAAGSVTPVDVHLGLTAPVLTWPTFSLDAVVGIFAPLVIVTAAGQNAPGLAMMTTAGYPPNDRALLGISAVASAVFAPWGSHTLNLAAVTAGIDPLGLVSAFWEILAGAISYAILRCRPARSPRSVPAR